ncbi:MAG: hypothetical protein PHQ75_09405 [Thermoguttaceae bacterium]|nr:hypothetical protein [Thermoguttaceae bacterium]
MANAADLQHDTTHDENGRANTSPLTTGPNEIDLNPYAAPPIPDEKDARTVPMLALTDSGEIDIAAIEAQKRKANHSLGLAMVVIVLSSSVLFIGIPVGLQRLHEYVDYYYLYSIPTWEHGIVIVLGFILFLFVNSYFVSRQQDARIKLARMLGLPDATPIAVAVDEATFIAKEVKQLEKEHSRLSEHKDSEHKDQEGT